MFISFKARDPKTGRQDRNHSAAILGTSRSESRNGKPGPKTYCTLSGLVAGKLAAHDFDVYTGGNPGVAEAANRAANKVEPNTSLAIHVKKWMDAANRKLKAENIFRSVGTVESGEQRTDTFINNCNHSINMGGGIGTGQEIWLQLEAKGYKWDPSTPAIDDIVVINYNGHQNPHLQMLDNIEGNGLGEHPEKDKTLRELVKEVKIDSEKDLSAKELEGFANEIVEHIIDEANSNSPADDQIEFNPGSYCAAQ